MLVLLSLPDCSFCCFMAKSDLCDRPLFSFPGAAFTEVSQFVKGGGTVVGERGITKSRTSCGRIRGREIVWDPEGSSIALLHVFCSTLLKDVVRPALPPYPSCPPSRVQRSQTQTPEGSGLAQEAPSLAVSQALEVAIPAHVTPLCLNVGVSKGFINARLRGAVRDHQPPGLPYAHMCSVTIWG